MKKMFSLVLTALMLCTLLIVPAFAAETDYVTDEAGLLTADEIASLNQYGKSLFEACAADILFAYISGNDFDEYAQQLTQGKTERFVLMIENDEYWDIYCDDASADILTDEDIKALREAYVGEKTYYDGIGAYMYTAATMIVQGSTAVIEPDTQTGSDNASGKDNTIILDTRARLVDMADILSDSEETALLEKLDEVSERQQMDVALVTVNSLDGKSMSEYADDFYDYNDYGFGGDKDGVLYLINIDANGSYSTGNSWISTCGYGITAFTDAGIQYIGEQITPDLLDGAYSSAFDKYITLCDDFITQAKSEQPYDVGNLPKGEFDIFMNLIIALVVGLLFGFLVTNSMKKKLNSVHSQSAASDYVKSGSFRVTRSQDLFLYTHTDRRAKPKDTGSSGGSSTHTSSSGRTHGGGGF